MDEPGNRNASTEVAAVRVRPSSQAKAGAKPSETAGAAPVAPRWAPLRRPTAHVDRPPAPDVRALRAQFQPARLRSFAHSSPGRLVAAGLVLMVLCVTAGAVTSTTVSEHQQALGVLLQMDQGVVLVRVRDRVHLQHCRFRGRRRCFPARPALLQNSSIPLPWP